MYFSCILIVVQFERKHQFQSVKNTIILKTQETFGKFGPLDLSGRVLREVPDELDAAGDELERLDSGSDEPLLDLVLSHSNPVSGNHHGRNKFLN